MRYTYNISDEAIVELIKCYACKNPYSISVQECAAILKENILGSNYEELIKLIEDLAEIDYFKISDGIIYT